MRIRSSDATADAWSGAEYERLRARVGQSVDLGSAIDAGPLLTPNPIIGYRMWTLGVGRVIGLRGYPWATPTMEAECRHAGIALDGAPHLGPGGGCDGRCGINAYSNPVALVDAAHDAPVPFRLAPGSPHVGSPIPEGLYGVVALSGRVVEHERGYRAQRGTVVGLVFLHGLIIRATSDPLTIAAQFPSPAASRRRYELSRTLDDASMVPGAVIEALRRLTPQ